jgi:hypothetical protein
MRKLRILVLLLPLASLALAQNADTQKRFAGTWEAKFRDKVICTIKLEAGESLSGVVQDCTINVNEQGDLIEPDASQSDDKPSPILDPKIDGDKLSFATKDEGDDPPMKFELKLTGATQAELHILSAPMPVKPIHFEKK